MKNTWGRVICTNDVYTIAGDDTEPKLSFVKGETYRALEHDGRFYDGLWEVHSWHKDVYPFSAFYFTINEFNDNFKEIIEEGD